MLIVDDHAASLSSWQRQTEIWGLLPSAAASREEALGWIERGQVFDVAIVDMQLSGVAGASLASEIRAAVGASLPLIGLLTPGLREALQPELFTASLTKPIKASRLYDALIDAVAEPGRPTRVQPVASKGDRLGDRHPLRVLVAEDNGVNQKVALAMLRFLGYRADLAADGVEAVEAVRRVPQRPCLHGPADAGARRP